MAGKSAYTKCYKINKKQTPKTLTPFKPPEMHAILEKLKKVCIKALNCNFLTKLSSEYSFKTGLIR